MTIVDNLWGGAQFPVDGHRPKRVSCIGLLTPSRRSEIVHRPSWKGTTRKHPLTLGL